MTVPQPLLLRRARLAGLAQPVDISIARGRIRAISPALTARPQVIDLEGRWVIPGLWDNHVHFTLWARHRTRLDVSGARSPEDVVALLSPARDVDSDAPLVARGFQDALWPREPSAEELDQLAPDRPVVVISHDLHSVWINTAAARRFRAPRAGMLREEAAFAVEIALDAEFSADGGVIADAVAAAASRGVVGIRDLEMADNPASWAARVEAGIDALRVDACFYPEHLDAVEARGLRTGRVVDGTGGLVTADSLKLFADGSLNTRTAWCHDAYPGTDNVGHAAHDEAELRALMADANARGFAIALHAIGDRAITVALDAYAATGASGTIEHAQLLCEADVPRFAALGIPASIQPEHALDDRGVSDVLWAGRTGRAFAYRALADAGAQLRLGSDAPVAALDPWFSIAAGTHRTRDDLPPWHPEQALTRDEALRASVRTQLVPGALADMAILDADPLTCDAATLRAMPVAATMLGGRFTFASLVG